MAYTEAQKIAIYKYRAKNREKINELAKKQYNEKTKLDPENIKKRNEYAKKYYKTKKEIAENNVFDNLFL